MTPPRVPAAQPTPTPDSPQESPEVQEARKAVDQAGYARNGAQAKYSTAVKDHGADSNEAKAAKAELDKAQAKVESAQADLRKVLKLSQGRSAPAKTASAPSPQKNQGNGAKPEAKGANPPKEGRPVAAVLRELRTESVPLHGEYSSRFRSGVVERLIELDPELSAESLEKILKEVRQKDKVRGEYLFKRAEIRHGETRRAVQLFLKKLDKPRTEAPHSEPPSK